MTDNHHSEADIPKLFSDKDLEMLSHIESEEAFKAIKYLSYELIGMMNRGEIDEIKAFQSYLETGIDQFSKSSDRLESAIRQFKQNSDRSAQKQRMERQLKARLTQYLDQKKQGDNSRKKSWFSFPISSKSNAKSSPKTSPKKAVPVQEVVQEEQLIPEEISIDRQSPVTPNVPDVAPSLSTMMDSDEVSVPQAAVESETGIKAPEQSKRERHVISKRPITSSEETEDDLVAIPIPSQKKTKKPSKKKTEQPVDQKENEGDSLASRNFVQQAGEMDDERVKRLQEYIQKDQKKGRLIDFQEGEGPNDA